jgi:hypothetical protein
MRRSIRAGGDRREFFADDDVVGRVSPTVANCHPMPA